MTQSWPLSLAPEAPGFSPSRLPVAGQCPQTPPGLFAFIVQNVYISSHSCRETLPVSLPRRARPGGSGVLSCQLSTKKTQPDEHRIVIFCREKCVLESEANCGAGITAGVGKGTGSVHRCRVAPLVSNGNRLPPGSFQSVEPKSQAPMWARGWHPTRSGPVAPSRWKACPEIRHAPGNDRPQSQRDRLALVGQGRGWRGRRG